jgi:phage-related tail protein
LTAEARRGHQDDLAGRQRSGELAALRAEARDLANAGEAERDAARAETAAAREDVLALSAQLGEARQAHAATRARWEAGRVELEAAGRQLAELRSQFSAELERAREQVVIAQKRAEASERRALRELDQERMARQKSVRPRHAHNLLQIRTAVLNDQLRSYVERWYPSIAGEEVRRLVAKSAPALARSPSRHSSRD